MKRRNTDRWRTDHLGPEAFVDELRCVARMEGHKWLSSQIVIEVGPEFLVRALNLKECVEVMKPELPVRDQNRYGYRFDLGVRLNKHRAGWRLFRK